MRTLQVLCFVILLAGTANGQEQAAYPSGYWQIGLGLGELPTGGSFKPSITFGYQFNEKIYTGLIYQFKDEIKRGASSFNAKSTGLDGLESASETVAQRFLLQLRYTPVKNGPYVSTGLVFNGKDTETMRFDSRDRVVGHEPVAGTIEIQQTRPAGCGLALGIGYQYNFKNGLSAGFEWTPAWGQYPSPTYHFGEAEHLSDRAEKRLTAKMDKAFKRNVTNMYKVFHIGLAYRVQ